MYCAGACASSVRRRCTFVVGHEGTVHAVRHASAAEHVKHVTTAQQRLGAHLVEDRAAVDLACHLERDARRHVGLDQAR